METRRIEYYTVLYGIEPRDRRIWLRTGNDYVAQIAFWPDDADLPPSADWLLYYRERDYANIIDLLRNEKPVFVTSMEIGSETLTYLRTGTEAIGEAEFQRMLVTVGD